MKLSEISAVWDILHTKDTGDVGYCDLEEAVGQVVEIENNIPNCLPQKQIK